MLKRHADKLVPALLALVLVVSLCVGASWLGRIEGICTGVNTNAKLVTLALDGEALSADADIEPFEPNSARRAIQMNWERPHSGYVFPGSVLTRP